jgi:hypothetical protein
MLVGSPRAAQHALVVGLQLALSFSRALRGGGGARGTGACRGASARALAASALRRLGVT